DAWQPWQPTPEQPWNLKWAGHFFRRAAFGAPPYRLGQSTWDSLQRAIQQGFDASLEQLFNVDEKLAVFEQVMDDKRPDTNLPDGPEFAGRLLPWWLYRLAYSPTPLRERMTLFWHNHFATSIVKVGQPELMMAQNQLFRAHALGKFGPLLLAVSRDPA